MFLLLILQQRLNVTKMKPYIIFDMDGVIIDSESWYINLLFEFLESKKISIPSDRIENSVGLDLEDFFMQNQAYFSHMSMQQFVEECTMFNRKAGEPPYAEIVFPYVQECFRHIYKKHIDIVVASSSPREVITDVLETLHLRKYVKFYLGKEDVQLTKPNPEIYLKAVQHQNSYPICVIEDSQYGIQAAKTAELKVFAFHSGRYKIDQSQADMIIEDHRDILEYLEN